ncbi:MAG: primosomal protein N' [Ottowia sp.]|nr:primosomal protein N' [Ottowia sp.]
MVFKVKDEQERIARVAIDTPLPGLFDYSTIPGTQVGAIVSVPFGKRQMAGVVVEIQASSTQAADKIKAVSLVCHAIPPLSTDWLNLCQFAAQYYLRSPGEVMLPALPTHIRTPTHWEKWTRQANQNWPKIAKLMTPASYAKTAAPLLLTEQQRVVDTLIASASTNNFAPFLLHGVTGSGKTEVYLHLMAALLASNTTSQILLLVPEINLTPQLEMSLRARFPEYALAVLHSGLAEGVRANAWLCAHLGKARIILGTRLAILASLPHLTAIIVDEEHDTSYKQQEGLRYSARDLAVWRGQQLGITVVLGSATPSLESWHKSEAHQNRYQRLTLSERAQTHAVLPQVHLVDIEVERKLQRPIREGITQPVLQAIEKRLARGEQSLLYLNRRGYAPVLHCEACGWLSGCPRCSVHLVLHRDQGNILRCHHCGLETRVPHHCPDCGNVDLVPLGRGTQRIEESLAALFPQARVMRIDADATRRKGSAQTLLSAVHTGQVDILVGTQMVAKGHDFQRITFVGILNPDAALHSHEFRASERLFAQLMQVAGRAGRAGIPGEVLVQTRYPQAAVYQALTHHDYPGYARTLIAQRKEAGFPPFTFQALLTVQARDLSHCLAFLQAACTGAQAFAEILNAEITLFDPVPCAVAKIAGRERAQLLVESASRSALQRFLVSWTALLPTLRPRQKWQIERDPMLV